MKKNPIVAIKKISLNNFHNVLQLFYDYCGHFENELKNEFSEIDDSKMTYSQFCCASFSNLIETIKNEK